MGPGNGPLCPRTRNYNLILGASLDYDSDGAWIRQHVTYHVWLSECFKLPESQENLLRADAGCRAFK